MGQHLFSQVPKAEIPRSTFDRTHGIKTTLDAGYLVPFMVDEVLPGDTFNLKANLFGRLATPITPIMDNLYLDTFFFFVPNRLVWTNWEKFNGAQDNPDDSTDFTIPVQTSGVGGYGEMSLQDYMGLPTKVAGVEHSALPLRAYNLIWNEWFRDQNLQDSVVVDKDDGPDTITDYVKLRRGKRHDYFTSCLPTPQKGPAVDLPIAGSAQVDLVSTTGTAVKILKSSDHTVYASGGTLSSAATTGLLAGSGFNYVIDPQGTLEADLSTATANTINELRQAFQIQKLYERDMRGGTRYVEILKSHFGVTSPDFRLQRPEFLGGSSSRINVTPIAQTSETATTAIGTLGAMGVVSSKQHGFVKSFTEHGMILGLCSIRADLNYQQGLNRMWSRQTRFDFFWPALAHLGEQAVLNKEIYCDASANDDEVFGYQERFAEYRYSPNKITGLFRSNATASLDTWHVAQDFSALPVLGSSFIQENPEIDRVIAVPSEPHMILDGYLSMTCTRPMPVYSVPGLIDHF